jgi:hypothetical protein
MLFLDGLAEFRRHVLEVLWQRVRRASHRYNLPRVLDLVALAALAARMPTATG